MELDFDKEIDTLLRKAVRGAPVSPAPGDHLEPDAIAAFTSGGLPIAAKDAYTIHLAECDRCRKQLALTASFNEETEAEPAGGQLQIAPVSVPWHRRLLGLPALAYTMGALALLLSGLIGYSVLQRSNNSMSPEVSQVYDSESQRGGPSFNEESIPQPVANSNTASSVSSTNTSVSSPGPSSNAMAANTSTMSKGISTVPTDRPAQDEAATGAGAEPPALPPATLATPQQQVMGRTAAETEKPRAEPKVAKEEPAANVVLDGVQTQNNRKKMKDQAPSATLSSRTAPAASRAQNQPADTLADKNSPAGRTVGGKTFQQRDGVWYDSSYRGQKTKKVRRGTKDYVRLDAGLRSIADSLGGTVVLVWVGKAYRIQ